MANLEIRQHIETARIIAIIRGNYTLDTMRAIAESLLAGGVSVVEVTMNSADAFDGIRMLNAEYGNRLLVGGGTVLDVAQVKAVAEAGARFTVSPDTFPEVIRAALDAGLEPCPGALTPGEIMQAHRAGARLVKLFPAALGGPEYLRLIRGPLDMIHFVPTGGIDVGNARAFLEAGAVALGVGSSLVWRSFDGSPAAAEELKRRARQLVDAVQRNPSVQMA